jgi:3-hydroxyisobutyrate dehydrogenase
MKKKIGFIGLGSMGFAIAGRLLSEGYELGVYNRTTTKADGLLKKGAWLAKTPRELAEKSDVVMLCVTDDGAIRAVMEGKSGALMGAKKGEIFIDCSTVSVSVTRDMDKKTKKIGAHWLDAPVLGNPKMSEDGEQSFVVGGDKKILEKVRPTLESIGTKIVYMGKSGLGQASKIVHSLTCAISLVAYSEAILLGEKFGLARKQTLDVLQNGAVASKLLSMKAPKLESNTFTPTAAKLFNMVKDLSLVTAEGKAFHQVLPALAVTKKLYDLAKRKGLSQEDTSSVIKVLKSK